MVVAVVVVVAALVVAVVYDDDDDDDDYLTIIELTMWPYGWPCVWQPTPKTADVTVTKVAGYVRVRIVMNRWFFPSYSWHSYFLRYGHFVE